MFRFFLLPFFALLAFGCRHQSSPNAPSVEIPASALAHLAQTHDQESLVVGGTGLAVKVDAVPAGSMTDLVVSAHGEEVERERYLLSGSDFSLVKTDTDEFIPPLPLLHLPQSTGQTWDWKGQLREETTRNASAHITTAGDRLPVDGGPTDAERVVVDLSIDSGSTTPAKRTLTFWFTPENGLVKREFGAGSTRQPLEPEK